MTNATDYQEKIRPEIESRFNTDEDTIRLVLERIEEARTMDELSGLHWDDPAGIADGIESFSRGHGLQAGWNTWIGIQRTDTSHLTIDSS